jgi:modulator of FtsH protease
MTPNVQTVESYGGSLSQVERNRVLRNTYVLLAISMIPTVLAAYIGVQTGIYKIFSGWMGLILFLGVAFGGIFAIHKTKNSGAGVPVLLVFTFFMGLVLSGMLARYLGKANGPNLIMTAFAGTAGVFAVMSVLATVIKRDLSGMGKWLFVGMLAVFFGAIINIFLGSSVMQMVISTMAVGIFSLYMLYDTKQIIDGGETNYITATLSMYLNILGLFQNLLALLGLTSSSD